MNIIIPIGGKGERFLRNGYKEPKPLINILGKPMIHYLLDNLNFTDDDKVFIIYYNINTDLLKTVVKHRYLNVKLIKIEFQTKGAAETIYEGLKTIKTLTNNKKTMLFDCDTFYTKDVISIYRNIHDNAVFFTTNKEENPIYSYISIDNNNIVTNIAEKKKISNNANTGIYCFNDITELFDFSKHVVENKITFNNECYTSCIIDQMIKNKKSFLGVELDVKNVFNLGTPQQLTKYVNDTYLFLFDLDGTMVLSENIYYEVWKEILHEYNVDLDENIFKCNISGNNDENSIKNILPNSINISIEKISQKKDALFCKYLNKLTLVDGLEVFLNVIKENGHKLAVVTNCNRGISELILEHFNLLKYFEFIVVGNECNNPKPYPDPYIFAVNKFNGDSKKTIIFEDSKTGILSALGVIPKCIVGIETNYEKQELINCGSDITIVNYLDLDFDGILSYQKETSNIEINIANSLTFPFESIRINSNKLKGGFISDVIDVKIKTADDTLNCVAKLENSCENFLTEMSKSLDLYEREYYFYEFLSSSVPVKTPKFYGIIYNENKKLGILLENINNENYKLNLNLNSEDVSVSFSVINSIAKLHSAFWNKNTHAFNKLKKNNDELFNPYWNNFVTSRWPIFKTKWSKLLTIKQLELGEFIAYNFLSIQQKLSDKNLTLCHGDCKSANIFYRILDKNNYEPYFIDWQYIVLGKGVQDLAFFMIESFNVKKMKLYKNLFKEYYYVKLLENGVDYARHDYDLDFENATYYFPFFVAMWFGTISEDELIDKSFPKEFITRLFNFYVN
jgi:beta-phosphoglucomutase-like phosphatase (HAD superfamily)/choline kinase